MSIKKLDKKCLHNANPLNITHLISSVVQLFNICNVLKLDPHEWMNIIKNVHKIVSELYFWNNQEKFVTSASEIKIRFVWKKKCFNFCFEKITLADLWIKEINQFCLTFNYTKDFWNSKACVGSNALWTIHHAKVGWKTT